MRRISTLILAFLVLLILAACSKSIIEQQKPSVIAYLTAFNKIDNDLSQTSSQIFTSNAASDLMQFNSALKQGVTTMNGVIQSIDSLKVPDIADVITHLDTYRQLIQDTVNILQPFQAAVLSGDQAAINKAEDDLTAISQRDSTFNRSTEALMTKYHISDAQVNYKSRGK
jgi:hypothetical protein